MRSRDFICSLLAPVLLCGALGTAAAETPAAVTPYLKGDEEILTVVTGNFGAPGTMVVVWWDLKGAGSYRAFGLVPAPSAKEEFNKVKIAKLPTGVAEGVIKPALIANLDKDPADELVLQLNVQRSGGGYSYASTQYVVLDFKKSAFVRMTALEAKLAKKMRSRKAGTEDPLGEADIKAALGLDAK